MTLEGRIAEFNSLPQEDRKNYDRREEMSDCLEQFIESHPYLPAGYHMLFLFSYHYGHDTEWSLEIATRYYQQTKDDLAALLMAVVEEEFRAGIDKSLNDLLNEIGESSPQWKDVCCYYQAMYRKKQNQPYEELLLQGVAINQRYPKVWLELAGLYAQDRELHNWYIQQAILNAAIEDYHHELLFSLDYYFRTTVYLNSVSEPQLQLMKSRLIK